MSEHIPYFPDRFQRAAHYYTTGRPAYPRLLSQRVAELIGLDLDADVLDIGTGPGFLAIDFAPYARSVTALDPSAEMLKVAADNAKHAGVSISWVHGSSYDLGEHFGQYKLATFGRSFHWTDRSKTLTMLDSLIVAGGAISLYSDSFPKVPQNAWHPAYQSLLAQHGKDDPVRVDRLSSVNHETVLLGSPFDHLERITVFERRLTPATHFIDRALSFGKAWNADAAAPSQDELAAKIKTLLAAYMRHDGTVEEVVEGRALIARRSRDMQPTLSAAR
jgi:SAM-dependent methyltransferase